MGVGIGGVGWSVDAYGQGWEMVKGWEGSGMIDCGQ